MSLVSGELILSDLVFKLMEKLVVLSAICLTLSLFSETYRLRNWIFCFLLSIIMLLRLDLYCSKWSCHWVADNIIG